MRNKLQKELNKLYDQIITHFQWSFLIIGVLCLLLSLIDIDECKIIKYIQDSLSQIGGIFISIPLISISFEKWRDKKSHLNEKYYLMNSTQLECGDELSKFEFFRFKGEGKILPIMKGEQLYNGDYSFKNMLINRIPLLENQTVLVYGTKLKFLAKIEDIFYESIAHGVNYIFSLVNPKAIGLTEEDIKDINESMDFIKMQIGKLKREHRNNIGSIEVRFTPYFTPHSFSSFVYKNKRKVRTLDFNFRDFDNSVVKYSQVFDTLSTNSGDHELEMLSDRLYEQYSCYYNRSLIAIKYPITEDLKFFVCGILEVPILGGFEKQVVLSGDTIPCIQINIITNEYIHLKIAEEFKKITGYEIKLKENISNNRADNEYCFIGQIISGEPKKNITLAKNGTILMN